MRFTTAFCSAMCATLLFGCRDSGTSPAASGKPPPPKFVKTFERTSHEITVAKWFVGIRNDGGPGTRLVNFWYGSAKNPASRKTLYSKRHTLQPGEEYTIDVRWEHGGLDVIIDSLAYGDVWGLEFLP